MAIIHTNLTIQNLNGYTKLPIVYNAAIKNINKNTNIYLAIGEGGLAHYTLREGSTQVQEMANIAILLNSVKLSIVDIIEITDIVDHVLGEQVFLLLDPNSGLVKVSLPR